MPAHPVTPGAALRSRWRAAVGLARRPAAVRRTRRALRLRLVALAAVLLAGGLVVGAVLMVALLHHSLTNSLDDGARRTGRQVIDLGVPPPDPLPVGGGNLVAVQVLNARGRVIGAAGPTTDHLFPLLTDPELGRARTGQVLALPGSRAGVTGRLRVVAVVGGASNAPVTAVVAVDAGSVRRSTTVLQREFFISVPVLVLLLSLLAWYVVGRALRPVEDLRRGAAEISDTATSRRLPVPAGRDEVHRLALTLNDMLARLDAASLRQRTFVADAAHELRSPLASLRTQLEVADHLGERADWPGTVAGALIDLDRLTRLVDDLLLLARLDSRNPNAERAPTPVDLGTLAHEVAGSYEHARVPVRVNARAGLTVPGHADGLRRVLRNLLDNAVRHAASTVTVTVTGSASSVRISVADDGPGIPAADRQRVFDRFTRRDDARSADAGGSGLGLAIVRELVSAHHGTVALADAQPGLRAIVSLPTRRG